MAKELDVIQRQISLNPQPLPAFTAGEALLHELKRFSQIPMTMATDLAIEQASIEGVKQRAAGVEYNLAPSITGPTEAFNRAYRDTDARIVARSGLDVLAQAYVHESDPRRLSANSVQRFNEKAQAIIQGTMQAALPENQFAIQDHLSNAASSARTKLMSKISDMENTRLRDHFNVELSEARLDYKNARFKENPDPIEIQAARSNIDKILNDGSFLSAEIAEKVPQIRKELERDFRVTDVVADYLEADSRGKGPQFIANLVDDTSMPFDEKMEAIDKVYKIQKSTNAAQAQQQAIDGQELENILADTTNPNFPTTIEEFRALPQYEKLNKLQQLNADNKFLSVTSSYRKQLAKRAEALQKVANGKAYDVPKKDMDDLFEDASTLFEQKNQRMPNMLDQFSFVEQLKTNVTKFDKAMNAHLQSQDPAITFQAAQVYAYAARKGKTQLLNLDARASVIGEELAFFINNGTEVSLDSVKSVIRSAMNPTDADIIQRDNRAKQWWSTVEPGETLTNGQRLWKDKMGSEPNAYEQRGAYLVFEKLFKSASRWTENQEAAGNYAKNAMRGWGKDPLFVQNSYGQAPPHTEFVFSRNTQAINNQLIFGLNKIFKDINESTPNSDYPPARIVNAEVPAQMSEYDNVFKKLLTEGDQPIVEIFGGRGEAKIESDQRTRSVPQFGYIYKVMVPDADGVYYHLPNPKNVPKKDDDPNNPLNDFKDGFSYIILNDLDDWAPTVYAEGGEEAARENLQKGYMQQTKEQIKQEFAQTTTGKLFNKLPLSGAAQDAELAIGEWLGETKIGKKLSQIPGSEKIIKVIPPKEPTAEDVKKFQAKQRGNRPEVPMRTIVDKLKPEEQPAIDVEPLAQAQSEPTSIDAKTVATRLKIKPSKHQNVTLVVDAANQIGVDPLEAAAIVYVESNFSPTAKATTSQARGLYQFIPSTWNEMVKRHGAKYNVDVKDINDPRANAIMGALLMKENTATLTKLLGRDPDAGEIYLAHFSGAQRAAKIIKAVANTPDAPASNYYTRDAIVANPKVIRGTIKETYDRLTGLVMRARRQMDVE